MNYLILTTSKHISFQHQIPTLVEMQRKKEKLKKHKIILIFNIIT